jgi:hypothetical protein
MLNADVYVPPLMKRQSSGFIKPQLMAAIVFHAFAHDPPVFVPVAREPSR